MGSGEIFVFFLVMDFGFKGSSDKVPFVAWGFVPHSFDNPVGLFGQNSDPA